MLIAKEAMKKANSKLLKSLQVQKGITTYNLISRHKFKHDPIFNSKIKIHDKEKKEDDEQKQQEVDPEVMVNFRESSNHGIYNSLD